MERVLVVGGGAYQVPLIRRLVELGYYAYCIDKNPLSPGFQFATESEVIDIIDKEACLEYAKRKNVNAVMTYGATLPLPTVSFIGERLHLPALPLETAETSKNKYTIKEKLRKAGCNIQGEFFRMSSLEDAHNHQYTLPCVIKPCDGSGSKGVSIVRNNSEIEHAIEYAYKSARYGEFYCESYIDGEEYSVEAFVDKEQIFIYGIIKTTFEKHGSDNESIEYGHRTPSGLETSFEDSISDEVKKAIRGLGINMGSVNFDVILSGIDGKPYIIDCGIRIGQNLIASRIVPLSRGVNILDNTIKQALGQPIDAAPKKRENIATRLLIYNPGTIKEIGTIEREIGKSGIVDIVLFLNDTATTEIYTDKSDTCGWVLCSGKSPDEAEENAINARRTLKTYFVIK